MHMIRKATVRDHTQEACCPMVETTLAWPTNATTSANPANAACETDITMSHFAASDVTSSYHPLLP